MGGVVDGRVRELHSEMIIEAPPQRVWDVLTQFASYPVWNPFIRAIQGDPTHGGTLRVTIQPPSRRPMTFSPRLLVVDPPRELRWLGRVGMRGLFDGEHSFELEPLGADRTRVTQHERFSGLLVPLMGRGLYQDSQRGFDDLMRALKHRVEARKTLKTGPKPKRRVE